MGKSTVLLSSFVILVLMSFTVIATPVKDTTVGGTIYNQDYSATISGADVTVTCNSANKYTSSNSNGVYGVQFSGSECSSGDTVTVTAIKGDLSGVEAESVYDFGLIVNLAIVNVPMTPEFGMIAGALTLLGAVGIFFVVRRD